MPDKKEKVININIPEDLHRELRIKAAENDTTIKEEVIRAIKKHLKEGGKQ